jgi:hypothetical protein
MRETRDKLRGAIRELLIRVTNERISAQPHVTKLKRPNQAKPSFFLPILAAFALPCLRERDVVQSKFWVSE